MMIGCEASGRDRPDRRGARQVVQRRPAGLSGRRPQGERGRPEGLHRRCEGPHGRTSPASQEKPSAIPPQAKRSPQDDVAPPIPQQSKEQDEEGRHRGGARRLSRTDESRFSQEKPSAIPPQAKRCLQDDRHRPANVTVRIGRRCRSFFPDGGILKCRRNTLYL